MRDRHIKTAAFATGHYRVADRYKHDEWFHHKDITIYMDLLADKQLAKENAD